LIEPIVIDVSEIDNTKEVSLCGVRSRLSLQRSQPCGPGRRRLHFYQLRADVEAYRHVLRTVVQACPGDFKVESAINYLDRQAANLELGLAA
jgi:hypothetical protein